MGPESVWQLQKESSTSKRPLVRRLPEEQRLNHCIANQPAGVEEAFFASCLDANGRMEVSIWARNDIVKLDYG